MRVTSLKTKAFSIFILGVVLAACKTRPAQPSPEPQQLFPMRGRQPPLSPFSPARVLRAVRALRWPKL